MCLFLHFMIFNKEVSMRNPSQQIDYYIHISVEVFCLSIFTFSLSLSFSHVLSHQIQNKV